MNDLFIKVVNKLIADDDLLEVYSITNLIDKVVIVYSGGTKIEVNKDLCVKRVS